MMMIYGLVCTKIGLPINNNNNNNNTVVIIIKRLGSYHLVLFIPHIFRKYRNIYVILYPAS